MNRGYDFERQASTPIAKFKLWDPKLAKKGLFVPKIADKVEA